MSDIWRNPVKLRGENKHSETKSNPGNLSNDKRGAGTVGDVAGGSRDLVQEEAGSALEELDGGLESALDLDVFQRLFSADLVRHTARLSRSALQLVDPQLRHRLHPSSSVGWQNDSILTDGKYGWPFRIGTWSNWPQVRRLNHRSLLTTFWLVMPTWSNSIDP